MLQLKCNMLKPDIVRLQHMVDAANEALSFIADKSKSDLESDRTLALALRLRSHSRRDFSPAIGCGPCSSNRFNGLVEIKTTLTMKPLKRFQINYCR